MKLMQTMYFGEFLLVMLSATVTCQVNLRIPIRENMRKGAHVASMSVIFKVDPIRRRNPLVKLSYKRLEETSAKKMSAMSLEGSMVGQPWVKLNTETGDLTLNRKLDREVECKNKQSECEQQLQVVLLPQEHFELAIITLFIEDYNDNAPLFPVDEIVLSVSESIALGDHIKLDKYQAKDADLGENSAIKYTISDETFFGLEQFSDNSGVPHLRLILRRKLDFSAMSSHQYTLTASDRGSPPQQTNIALIIKVEDANDHAPVFDQKTYIVNLPENQTPNRVVATVHATDQDSGDFARVTYHLPDTDTSLGQTDPGNLISLDLISGEVTLRQKLDRELHDGLKMIIEARDSAPANLQKVGKAILEVHVADVNDNPPAINVDFIVDYDGDTGYLPENSDVNSFVALISCSDEDSGINGDCTVELSPFISKQRTTKDWRSFELNEEGFLQTLQVFDNEKKNLYKLNITACDKGSPSLCSFRAINVVVLDQNEFAPTFSNPSQHVTLAENSRVGKHIATCKATDDDYAKYETFAKGKDGKIKMSSNGKVLYRIESIGAKRFATSASKNPFSFDDLTGKISLSRRLDYEKAQKWKITVTAKDEGLPQLSSYCIVTITLNDVNDNRPVFTNPAIENSTLNVGIQQHNNKRVTTLKAIDFDTDITSGISYSIQSIYLLDGGGKLRQLDDVGLFNLSKASGKFFLNAASEEDIGEYFMKIRATDDGNVSMFREVGLFVTVSMNAPVIQPIVPTPYAEQIEDAEQASFTILAVALGVGIGAVLLLIVVVALLVVYIRKKSNGGGKDLQEDPTIQRTPSLRDYSTTSSDKQSSRHDVMLSSLTSSPTSTMGKRSIFNNNSKRPLSCSKPPVDEPCYVCDLKSSSASIGQHSPYHKLVENMMICGKNSKPTSPSDHDSGKGSSDTKEDDEELNKRFFPDTKLHSATALAGNNSARSLGPKCSQACREYGHSDTCWMPSSSFYVGTQHPTSHEGKGRHGSVCSSETENTTSSSSGPSYYRINARLKPTIEFKSKFHKPSTTDNDVTNDHKSAKRQNSDSGLKKQSQSLSVKTSRSPSRAGSAMASPIRRNSDISSPTKARPTALQLPRLPYKNDNHYFENYSERSPTKVTFVDDVPAIPSSPSKHSRPITTKVAIV